jgi:hypothetical protein
MGKRSIIGAAALVACLGAAQTARADDGGALYAPPPPEPPALPAPTTAVISNGRAIAPAGMPVRVRHILTAANRLIEKPYRWGGGHRDFSRGLDRGYDCSGSVSYALYGGRLLTAPLDSTGLADFGREGPGRWVTIFANRGHVFVVVAGLRFDTGWHDAQTTPAGTGPRWSAVPRSSRRYAVRHPRGF